MPIGRFLLLIVFLASILSLVSAGTARATPLGYDDARHLLNRTGFAASDAEIREYAKLTRAGAADKLLAATRIVAQTPPPASANEPLQRPRNIRQMSEEERKAFLREQIEKGVELRAWWYREMRSIEIWDTSSKSIEYLQEGWLTRAFTQHPTPPSFAADGVIVGSADLGPLAGGGTRAIALANTEHFLRQARLAHNEGRAKNKTLEHILKVEADIVQAAAGLAGNHAFKTEFPAGAFGNAIKTACQVVANKPGVAVNRVSLNGFDTHNNQPATHIRLLKEFASGITALKSALIELDRWNETLLLTYAEFGRRPRENQSNGTDHGTANAHFALGGRVKGGLYGEYPSLERLNSDGNMAHTVDFRSVYATALESWWRVPAGTVLGGKFVPLPLVRTS